MLIRPRWPGCSLCAGLMVMYNSTLFIFTPEQICKIIYFPQRSRRGSDVTEGMRRNKGTRKPEDVQATELCERERKGVKESENLKFGCATAAHSAHRSKSNGRRWQE